MSNLFYVQILQKVSRWLANTETFSYPNFYSDVGNKWNAGGNFTNILWAAFLYEIYTHAFFVLKFGFKDLWGRKLGEKLLLKYLRNWPQTGEDREIFVRTTIRELVVYCAFLTVLCLSESEKNSILSQEKLLPHNPLKYYVTILTIITTHHGCLLLL